MGRRAETLWATSPTSRRRCLLDAIHALRFEWAFERWPRCRGPTNMRRVRFVLWLRSCAPRHCVVTHRSLPGTTTARHHSPRPLVKQDVTKRLTVPRATDRRRNRPVAPKVHSSHGRRARRGTAARQLSRANPRGRAAQPYFPHDSQGRGARKRQARQARARLQASDIVRVPPVRTGAQAPPRRAPSALLESVTAPSSTKIRSCSWSTSRPAWPCTAAAA